MRRVVLATVAGVLALIGLASPAVAHNALTSSSPADGASVAAGPGEVTLTFDQKVQRGTGNRVAVVGPDDSLWAHGPVEVDGNVVTRSLAPLGPAGKYTIGYSILSADGHTVRGELTFTLTQDGAGEPVGELEDGDDSGGIPLWVWISGAVLLLAGGIAMAMRFGKEAD